MRPATSAFMRTEGRIRSAVTATIIDGKAIAVRVRAEVARDVAEFVESGAQPPGLATVLVGEDSASAVYVGGKQRACAEVGMTPYDERLPADASLSRSRAVCKHSTMTQPSAVSCCSCRYPTISMAGH